MLHSAQVFNPDNGWLIHSPDATPIAKWLVASVSVFRMPAFFIVAGFFCLLSLRRYEPREFAVLRLERIAVPLVVTALLLNSLQTAILSGYFARDFDLAVHLSSGAWMSHLWFLVHLLVFLAVAYGASRVRWSPASLGERLTEALSRLPPLALIAAVAMTHLVAFKALAVTGALGHGVIIGVFDFYAMAWNAPFFAFGLLLAHDRRLLARFEQTPPLAAIGIAVVVMPVALGAASADAMLVRVGADFLKLLAIWSAVAACFRLFHRYANAPSPTAAAMSRASYTVYLFHHLLVIVFAVVLIELGVGGLPGLIVLTTGVAGAALFIHHFIVAPSPIGRYLFNGIRARGHRSAAGRPDAPAHVVGGPFR